MKNILIKPLISEKNTALTEKRNVYVFQVDKQANKIQIKQEIEQFYNVHVNNVNTAQYVSTAKSRMSKSGMISGRISGFKKAYITLTKGDNIDLYEQL